MAKPDVRSVLYRLIEAGQLAHRALLVPLRERGLEPGDDAILFLLHRKLGATDGNLAHALDTDPALLAPNIQRLIDHNLIERRAIGPELTPGLALTERGDRIRDALGDNWSRLEAALFGDLKKKDRRALKKSLVRFTDLLGL